MRTHEQDDSVDEALEHEDSLSDASLGDATLDVTLGDEAKVPAPPSRLRGLAAGACLLVAAALGGLSLAEHARASRPPPSVRVELDGAALPSGDPAALAEQLASAWESQPMRLSIAGETREGTRASMGAHVDRARLTAQLTQAADPTSLLRRYRAQQGTTDALALQMPVTFDGSALAARLQEDKDQLDVRPRDARLQPRTGEVQAEQVGRRLDVFGTLEAVESALRSGASMATARIEEELPTRTASQLREVRVEAVLGAFETHYSTLEEAADRSFNLRVAASKLDGHVLFPGETLDFNALVGERSEANGFRPAPQIAGGEVIDGVGGGTCQISGTLHAAAFFAGLPIVERTPHSRPSGYIWMGLDSMVVYAQHNLRFTNDFPFPVVIGMTVEGGIVRAELRGASTSRMVTFTRRVDSFEPFTEREVQDPSIPAGARVLRQRGVPGFHITRFRIVRDVAHNQARRVRWEDIYPPTEQIWRVGTGPALAAGATLPEGDSHPEYTADELLSASFGAGVNDLEITRRAGTSGTPGWLVQAGMPSAEVAE
jgi:vancomycin resistance protein YoaR